MSSRTWEYLVYQIDHVEFPSRASWGLVPNDKVVRSTATPDELRHIMIVQDWAT